MPRAPAIALLLVLASLAGCAAPAATAPADPDAPLLFASNDASDCRLAVAVLLVPFAQAQRAMPDGFTPRDAQGLLGTPAPTGKAGVLLGSYRCETSALGPAGVEAMEVNILVERPEVAGERAETNLDYYQPVVYTASEPLLALLVEAGWNVVQGGSAVDVTPLTTGARGTGAAQDADGDAARFEATGLVPNALTGLSRFWHQTPGGLSHFDFAVDAQVLAGGVSCELREGSAVAEIAGVTTCAPGDAAGIVVPSLSWTSEFRHIPGASAT